jgi:hypothetical protein
MYHYMLRELSSEWVAKHDATPFNRRQVIRGEMNNWDVVATAIRPEDNPLYQNWIYRMDSGIFVWVDPTTTDADITIDTLGAFGVPDWTNEKFNQHTTIAIMYPNKTLAPDKNVVIQGARKRNI